MWPYARLVPAALLAVALLACDEGGGGAGGANGSLPVEKLVFVSSLLYSGDIGGVDAADAECQALADAAGLGGEYMAWLSDGVSSPALDFTRNDGPYVLVDGTLVADDWTDLTDGTLQNPIDLDEYGDLAPLSDRMCGGTRSWVMTGTYESGTHPGSGADCSGWTSNLGGGTWGRSDATASWSFACTGGANRDQCASSAPIFCFEQ